MEINATLLGQFITFIVLVWFTMKYVWPPLMKAVTDRQARIAEGLAAAERGVHELELAQHKYAEIIRDAQIKAIGLIEDANKRANRIVDEAKERARQEGDRLLMLAQEEINQEKNLAKQQLIEQVGSMVIVGTEKLLRQKIDAAANAHLLEQLINEI